MNKDIILLHLSLIDGIGPITVKKILEKVQGGFDLQDLYRLKTADFADLFGLSRSIVEKLSQGLQDKTALQKEYDLIQKNDITFVSLANKNYPQLLANIYAPPIILYWQGVDILNAEKKVAFVGSRKAHRYGEKVIHMLVPDLVKAGCVIVSGGAIGADSMAHRATVNCGGKTIAILGSGLLKPYPYSNRRLFDDIVQKGGAIVSSFPLQTEAKPGNFPARNRIIAGLSIGCVVVQAAAKSGACITAQCALDEGRDVFAIPGPIDDELSQGCHNLIGQGAKLVGCSEDILVEMGCCVRSVEVKNKSPRKKVAEKNNTKNNLQCIAEHVNNYENDNSIEGAILRCCKNSCSTDEIAAVVDMQISEIHELLFNLQLDGKIKQNHAGMWEKT